MCHASDLSLTRIFYQKEIRFNCVFFGFFFFFFSLLYQLLLYAKRACQIKFGVYETV